MALPQAGWMPDPSVRGVERYWDGAQWTTHVRESAPAVGYEPSAWRPVSGPMGPIAEAPVVNGTRRPRRVTRTLLLFGGAALGIGAVLSLKVDGGASLLERWGFARSTQTVLASAAAAEIDLETFVPVYEQDLPLSSSTEFARYVEQSLIDHDTWIDISPWRSETNDPEAVKDAVFEAVTQSPYIYVNSWTIQTIGGEPRTLSPTYTYSPEETERRQAATLEASRQAAVFLELDGLDAAAQAARIHDYVAQSATYDDAAARQIESTGQGPHEAQEAYGILVGGSAVCGGYASAFQAIALEAGLPSVVVTGDSWVNGDKAAHAWNRVNVEGRWLTVDVTFDDSRDLAPVPDGYLLLPGDDPSLDTRATDKEWMTDANIDSYGS